MYAVRWDEASQSVHSYSPPSLIELTAEEIELIAGATDWGHVANATAGGAIAGGVGGAVGGAAVGFFVTGVGAGPGALAGGVAGFVCGGITGGVREIWNQWT